MKPKLLDRVKDFASRNKNAEVIDAGLVQLEQGGKLWECVVIKNREKQS